MKKIVFFLAMIASTDLLGQSVNCQDAPEAATTELPNPISDWAVIFCSPKNHAIAAIDGRLWIAKNGKPYMFRANPTVNSSSEQRAFYFVGAVHRKLEGSLKTNTNKMLARATRVEDQTLQPWQLDVISNSGLRYNIFFYEKDGVIEHVLGCTNECKQSVLLRDVSLEQLKKELNN